MDPIPIFIPLFIDLTIGIELLSLVILLILSALISGTEIAFFSLNKLKIDSAVATKKANISIVIEQLKNPKKLLATILIANNFVNILFIIIFTYVSDYFFTGISSKIIKFFIEIVLVTFLILLFGEVLPKVYATRNAMKMSLFMAKPIRFLNTLFSFLSVPLMNLSSLIENKLQKKQSDITVETLTEALKLTAHDTSTEEQKILEGIVNFGNTETNQVMCPRIDVFAISIDEPFEKVLKKIIGQGHSRIPVFSDNIDNIKGILYSKDLLKHANKKTFKWENLLREANFVPENKKLDDLLKEFKDRKNHLAIVVDEYGGTSGIVTLEDVIEEIVGDIKDEHDDDGIVFSKLDNHNYIFDAKISVKDFCKALKLDIDEFDNNKGESETLAGFILEVYEKIPKKNDVILFNDLTFTIESLNKKRIKQIKVTLH